MAGMHREFDMPLDKHSMFIVDLLPETYGVRPRLVKGSVSPGEGGGLGARQGYASFLTRRAPAKAGDLLSIRRMASGSNTLSPHAGHSKKRSCGTVYRRPLNSPDQLRRTCRIRPLPQEGQV